MGLFYYMENINSKLVCTREDIYLKLIANYNDMLESLKGNPLELQMSPLIEDLISHLKEKVQQK